MKFTINIEGDGLRDLFLNSELTKQKMDALVDEHAQIYGMSDTLRRVSELTGETTLYHVSIGKWAYVYAKLKDDIAKRPDMLSQKNWLTEVA